MEMEERLRLEYIAEFLRHTNFTGISLAGEVLVIGPGDDFLDIYPVIPSLRDIRRLDFVSDRFSAKLAGAIGEFNETCVEQRLNIEVSFAQNQDFRGLRNHYDNAVFFGAQPSFAKGEMYMKIPQILKPGGVFYGTVNHYDLPNKDLSGLEAKAIVYRNIHPHPYYNNPWSGVVIKKDR